MFFSYLECFLQITQKHKYMLSKRRSIINFNTNNKNMLIKIF